MIRSATHQRENMNDCFSFSWNSVTSTLTSSIDINLPMALMAAASTTRIHTSESSANPLHQAVYSVLFVSCHTVIIQLGEQRSSGAARPVYGFPEVQFFFILSVSIFATCIYCGFIICLLSGPFLKTVISLFRGTSCNLSRRDLVLHSWYGRQKYTESIILCFIFRVSIYF